MKTLKRILFVLLAVILTVSAVASVGAETLTFTDTDGHWAWTGGYIPYLVEKNVLNGYKQNDGTYFFKPDGEVTRAEFIKMLDETFGLTETKAVSFSDVKSSDWFCVYFQKAAAQGYILNYGSSCDPNGKITREEAISLLVRYLDLNPEEKASAATFTDYYTINEKYQDYVLEAIYAGLIDGYKQTDGTYKFKPENTLTRAEALTILYRAAGCIFNKNAFVRDGGAAATNNVITKGNITIQDQTLTGRTIVSEGAKDGIVTFSNCKIEGTLYIRGNAKVYFDKCTVNDVEVNGEGGVSLLTNSTVKTMNLNKKAQINISKGAKVGELNVNGTASNSTVIGEGIIDNANIKASGFKSDIMPSEYKIFNNLSAVLDGKTYTGTQDGNEIFKISPFARADKDNYYYIEFTATKDGSAYFYYTDATEAPTAAEFDANYTKAVYKGYITAKANEAVAKKTYTATQLKDYPYVVVMYQVGMTKYNPILVTNSAVASDGFTTDPYYSEIDNSIKYKASTNGTVYMYYTDKGDALTPTTFVKEYENKESSLKTSVAANTKEISSLALNAAYAKQYGYIAIMLKSASGVYNTPVIVAIADDGFTTLPSVKTSGMISYKTNVDGTLYYYYSKTETVPTPANFGVNYAAAAYSGSVAAKNAVDATLAYKPAYASVYQYMIVCIRTAAGEYKLPVCVDLGYESGFLSVPKLVSDTLITFTTKVPGVVQYYYTDSASAPTAETFASIYTSMPQLSKGTINCYTASFQGQITIGPETKEKYVVIMLTDTNKNTYAPIVLSLKYDPNDLITGFVYDPYVQSGEVYIKTAKESYVRYYYSSSTAPVTSAEFYTNYTKADPAVKGELAVTPQTLYKLAVNKSAQLMYRTIVLATWNGTSYSEPVVIDAFVDSPKPSNTVGFTWKMSDGIVIVTPSYDGTLYYYATDDKADAESTVFDKTKAASISVTGAKTAAVNNPESKKYIILCLEAKDYRFDKIAIVAETGKQYTVEAYNDNSNSTKSMLNIANNSTDHIVKYQPSINATIFFTLVGDNEVMTFNGSNKPGNVWYADVMAGSIDAQYDYSTAYATAAADTAHTHVYLYIQLIDVRTMTYYKSEVITLK